MAEKSTVTYVDSVEMQKPVLVETGVKIGQERDETIELDEIEFGTGHVTLDDPVIDLTVETPDDVLLGKTDDDTTARETLVIDPVVEETTTIDPVDTSTSEELVETDTGTTTVDPLQPITEEETTTIKTSVSYPQHTVKRGDTLWSISRDYDCSISELCAANNISRRQILRVGQTLVIPKMSGAETTVEKETVVETGGSTTVVEEKTTITAPTVETEFYTVQSGDSYWKISRAHGISVDELMALNDTSSDFLKIGQKILVPKK
jgi:LysM repeat protein